jgi:chlorobactene glucosyltransferase
MIYYQYIITAILAFILINFIINMIFFKNIRKFSLPEYILKNPPLVSVLIPARNEAENIYRCLSSLSRQDYPNLEIIVLDDNSTDRTSEVVRKFAVKDSRISLVNGEPLKKGWLGKCFACQQLAKQAKGDYFVFTDADTLHFASTISKAFAALINNRLDALSIYPSQITVTFHERMTVPFINFAILSFMPLLLVKKAKSSFFSTGIGQFFLFKREVYEKFGGHESIKGKILEDIYISKQVKKFGYKIMVFDGSNNIFCRMYHNFDEVIKGFTKVILAAFNYNGFMEMIAISFFSILFLAPFLLLPTGVFIFGWSGPVITFNIIQICIILFIKIILAMRFKNRILDVLLTPVSVAYMVLIAGNSYFQAKFGKGIYWKGRTYSVEDEDELGLIDDTFGKRKA